MLLSCLQDSPDDACKQTQRRQGHNVLLTEQTPWLLGHHHLLPALLAPVTEQEERGGRAWPLGL